MRTDIRAAFQQGGHFSLALLALTGVVLLFLPALALGLAPHVVTTTETDSCAMCHRGHTAASSIPYRNATTGKETGNALIVGTYSAQSELCFTCHGVTALGSTSDVESAFSSESSHSLDTTDSVNATPKRCSSCHDIHGEDKRQDGSTFPALLRAWVTTSTAVYAGDELCASCHPGTENDRWDGLDVWRQTAHSRIATPTSGTGIICSACHDPHGSDAPPMLAGQLTPPSAPTTVTVPANDRRQCFACHLAADDTYPGETAYQSSAHGSSNATVPAEGEWADRLSARTSTQAERKVGECQACHAPMGRADSSGTAIPKLLEAEGRALCDSCHRAGSPTGGADIASLAYPSTEASEVELLAAFEPASPTDHLSSIAVWSRDTTGPAPRDLVGPREYGTGTRAGAVAAGAIEGDGQARLIVAVPGDKELDVYSPSPLSGIQRTATYQPKDAADAPVTPDLVAVGDFILDASGRPEIAVVDRTARQLHAYRLQGGTLERVASVDVSAGPSSIAVGRLTGSDRTDIVVTAEADDVFHVISESGSTLAVTATVATPSGPTGASIGDAWSNGAGVNEIVIANSGVTTGNVSVFPGTGGPAYASYDATGVAGAFAVDTVVANVLPDTVEAEVVVALRSASKTGASALAVFERSDPGLGNRQDYMVGAGQNVGGLEAGDLDGDGKLDLVVGNGGNWSRDNDEGVPPSVWVMRSSALGTTLDTGLTERLYAGGVERAGSAPPIVIADMGGVGSSRHPVGAGSAAHVSTETVPVARHVECVDCHDAHEADASTATAPAVYGALKGAAGVSMESTAGGTNYQGTFSVENEYEVCLKCHSSAWAALGDSRDIASEIATTNASTHAVAGPSASASAGADTFTDPKWSKDSTLYCVDCHTNADVSQAKGPHASDESPILRRPYFGTLPSDSELLCYSCHKRDLYLSGAGDAAPGGSGFRNGATKLHNKHVGLLGFSCASCHASHGSDSSHLIAPQVGYAHTATGGSCTNACHAGGSPAGTQTYAR